MNWYKIAQAQNYPVWLANQIKEVTNNYQKPLGHYENYLPKIEKWIKETNADLTNLTLDEAAKKAIIHEHDKVPEDSMESRKRNMNSFYANSQNLNPNAPNFAVDMRLKPKAIPQSTKNKINKEISKLTSNKWPGEIPITEIMNICENHNVVMLMETGERWSGFLLGGAECGSEEARKQQTIFELAMKQEDGTYAITKNSVSLSWCTMHSGKYEIVCYLS
jgi:hypothetical protein